MVPPTTTTTTAARSPQRMTSTKVKRAIRLRRGTLGRGTAASAIARSSAVASGGDRASRIPAPREVAPGSRPQVQLQAQGQIFFGFTPILNDLGSALVN